MKTAIALPDALFERAEAERLARRCSRSALYAMALEHFLNATERPREFGILPGIASSDEALFEPMAESELAEWGIE
jgi:hypothetical protein